jgi:hypothetical protein
MKEYICSNKFQFLYDMFQFSGHHQVDIYTNIKEHSHKHVLFSELQRSYPDNENVKINSMPNF